jgi:uncharacterized protein (TIGR02596 family)
MESLGVNPKERKAFSLIELLTVIAIMGVLLAFSIGGYFTITSSTLLTSTGDELVGKLVQAQQRAIAESTQVEVRLYKYTTENNEDVEWSLALTRRDLEGVSRALENPYYLPRGVTLHQSSALSPLLSELPETEDADRIIRKPDDEGTATYTSFRFFSDGGTDLPDNSGSGDTWHITIVTAGSDVTSQTPPKNFFTIRVDPYSGSIRSFRP